MATNEKTISPMQRAQLFAQGTRQNIHTLPKKTGRANDILEWTLPKARLLAKTFLKTEVFFNAVVLDNKINPAKEEMDSLFRSISLDLNNGFSPFKLSGEGLNLLNATSSSSNFIMKDCWKNITQYYDNAWCFSENRNGKTVLTFFMEMQNSLNDRDAIGLILLQNDSTYANLQVSIGDCKIATDIGDIDSVSVTPVIETFSIPAYSPDAMPDLSVLKLCNSRIDTFPGSGQNLIKLMTGTIYRRIIFKVMNDDGTPMELSDISSDICLIFNQADTNYSIDPAALRALNFRAYGHNLPKGVFVWDAAASQGLPNLAGSRDYIDSEKLTELWLRFSTEKSGKCLIVTETLARLR